MTRFRIIIAMICLVGGISSCKKSGLTPYKGTADIYFERLEPTLNNRPLDSISVSFAYAVPTKKDSLVKVIVRSMGAPSSVDRVFKVVAASASTAKAGKHYEPLPATFTMHAGLVKDTVTIKLLRSADMQDSVFVLDLELQPNESFTTNYESRAVAAAPGGKITTTHFRIAVSDKFGRPTNWSEFIFGIFSKTKFFTMCTTLELDASTFNNNDMRINYLNWGVSMQYWLNDQKMLGNIIMDKSDADGTLFPMTMGTQVQ